MNFHFTRSSSNSKTGPIPVTTTSMDSCPTTCTFFKGCYAKSGPILMHWKAVSNGTRGGTKEELFEKIKDLPKNQLWRMNQAGDLPHRNGNIDENFMDGLIKANHKKNGFTYTHHILNEHNIKEIKKANENGFTVNISANNIEEAAQASSLRIPIVCVVPSDIKETHFIHKGSKFLVCPATYREKMNCEKCGLCQKKDRKYIVAFPAHGTQKNHVNKIIDENIQKS